MRKLIYLGLDAHASHCVLGGMDTRGDLLFSKRLRTAESVLISHIVEIQAREKLLVLEESSLAGWLSGSLRQYVDQITVCDPRQNALISRNAHKSDESDVYNLCKLLRLGELRGVYHPEDDHRASFKSAVQHYFDLRNQQSALKTKIKAKYRGAGVMEVQGDCVYSAAHRAAYLAQIKDIAVRAMVEQLYGVLDVLVDTQDKARQQVIRLGRRYREIRQFMKMPGVGPIGAHVFDAYVQTPHRFATKQKLWRYCRLGIVDRSSNGKPLAYKRLDRAGNGELKAMSYRAWLTATRISKPNEVSQFYEASLERTHNATRARLNTQRKILAVLWSIWKRNVAYNPDLFLRVSQAAA